MLTPSNPTEYGSLATRITKIILRLTRKDLSTNILQQQSLEGAVQDVIQHTDITRVHIVDIIEAILSDSLVVEEFRDIGISPRELFQVLQNLRNTGPALKGSPVQDNRENSTDWQPPRQPEPAEHWSAGEQPGSRKVPFTSPLFPASHITKNKTAHNDNIRVLFPRNKLK
ncbi:hypothetical protein [Kiloniella sp. b19]|uniref:hypothetical protein n=1 Tax=Kiloniella sp. GXU_MW_B19 TaxID=3141326 RepID=UPI0031D46C66